MSSKTTTPENGLNVPWYGYLMIFLLYVTPFMLMTPVALLTGLFTLEEFEHIFSNPFINMEAAILIIGGGIMTLQLRSTIIKFQNTPDEIKKFNKRLKLVDTINIVLHQPFLLYSSYQNYRTKTLVNPFHKQRINIVYRTEKRSYTYIRASWCYFPYFDYS